MEKTITRETAIKLTATLDAFVTSFETWLTPDYLEAKRQLINQANKELYPALFDQDIDLEKSFDKLKAEIGVPTNDRYSIIPG